MIVRHGVLLVFLPAWKLTHQHMASGFVQLRIVVAPELVYEGAHLSLAFDIATNANFKPLKYSKAVPLEWYLHEHDSFHMLKHAQLAATVWSYLSGTLATHLTVFFLTSSQPLGFDDWNIRLRRNCCLQSHN